MQQSVRILYPEMEQGALMEQLGQTPVMMSEHNVV